MTGTHDPAAPDLVYWPDGQTPGPDFKRDNRERPTILIKSDKAISFSGAGCEDRPSPFKVVFFSTFNGPLPRYSTIWDAEEPPVPDRRQLARAAPRKSLLIQPNRNGAFFYICETPLHRTTDGCFCWRKPFIKKTELGRKRSIRTGAAGVEHIQRASLTRRAWWCSPESRGGMAQIGIDVVVSNSPGTGPYYISRRWAVQLLIRIAIRRKVAGLSRCYLGRAWPRP